MPLEAIFFIIKAAGAACVLAGCTGMGYFMCAGVSARLAALKEFSSLMLKMSGEIRCMAEPMPHVLAHLKNLASPVYKDFFSGICQDLVSGSSRTLAEIWAQNADMHLKKNTLKSGDIQLIKELGAMLGSHDTKMQLSVLELFMGQLAGIIGDLSSGIDNQKRIYGGLWILGGIFIVIVFI